MAKYADLDAYIAATPEEYQRMLIQIRQVLSKVLPDAYVWH